MPAEGWALLTWWKYVLIALPVVAAYVALVAWIWIDSNEQYHRLKALYDRNPGMNRPKRFR
jgi:hypothetical protein